MYRRRRRTNWGAIITVALIVCLIAGGIFAVIKIRESKKDRINVSTTIITVPPTESEQTESGQTGVPSLTVEDDDGAITLEAPDGQTNAAGAEYTAAAQVISQVLGSDITSDAVMSALSGVNEKLGTAISPVDYAGYIAKSCGGDDGSMPGGIPAFASARGITTVTVTANNAASLGASEGDTVVTISADAIKAAVWQSVFTLTGWTRDADGSYINGDTRVTVTESDAQDGSVTLRAVISAI